MHGGASALLHDKRGGSVHGGRTYWRILRAAASAAKWQHSETCTLCAYAHADTSFQIETWPQQWLHFTDLRRSSVIAGSVHGTNDYLRWVGRSTEERAEQRKAARLCLDTSAHAGSEFQQLISVLSNVSHSVPRVRTVSDRPGSHITQKASEPDFM